MGSHKGSNCELLEVYSKPQPGPLPRLLGSYLSRLSAHNFIQIKYLILLFQHTSTVECRSCVVYAQYNNPLPVWIICHKLTNLYLHQFSAISGGNCISHCPRHGHVDHLKRVCGYVKKFPQGALRFCTGIPDHESIFSMHPVKYEWMETVYGCPNETLPDNAPPPKRNKVRTTTYADANLLHDLVTGRSATGILHFLNQTPIYAFSKCQNQVESTTYGSEFMAAHQSV